MPNRKSSQAKNSFQHNRQDVTTNPIQNKLTNKLNEQHNAQKNITATLGGLSGLTIAAGIVYTCMLLSNTNRDKQINPQDIFIAIWTTLSGCGTLFLSYHAGKYIDTAFYQTKSLWQQNTNEIKQTPESKHIQTMTL